MEVTKAGFESRSSWPQSTTHSTASSSALSPDSSPSRKSGLLALGETSGGPSLTNKGWVECPLQPPEKTDPQKGNSLSQKAPSSLLENPFTHTYRNFLKTKASGSSVISAVGRCTPYPWGFTPREPGPRPTLSIHCSPPSFSYILALLSS